MVEPIFIKIGMYIMAHELISTAYFINLSHRFLCLPLAARQRLGKKVNAATLTRNNC
jgi:hypothetical protein